MKNLSVTSLIDFRGKSDRSKTTFINNLKLDEKPDSGGGNYWSSCLSAIGNVYRYNKTELIAAKIDELQAKITEDTHDKKTNDMYQRNINILRGFLNYNFQDIKPSEPLTYHKKIKTKSVIEVNGLPIKVVPHYLFSFTNNQEEREIGAIWLVAKLSGYKKEELGMFTDVLFRYLSKHFSQDYRLNADYCLAVDVSNKEEVRYRDIANGSTPLLVDRTINDIKKSLS